MVKDILLFLGGLAGIGYQQITGKTDLVLLIVFTTMIGLPGVANTIRLIRGDTTTVLQPQSVSSESGTEYSQSSSTRREVAGDNDSVRDVGTGTR